ncbi:MAG: hypothetical protein KDA92_03950 [Planctomycetales bacterium]|nr:hypothetical protein [Planctomycetales bacterium]MCA9170831.1 hypothetical protein [Planctomycetales bacterium]
MPVPSKKQAAPTTRTYEDLLKVSTYDQVAGLLVSALFIVGVAVGALVIIWVTSQVFSRPPAPEMVLVEEEEGTQNPEGTARDINEPGIEELDLAEPDVQDTLAAVTDAVSSVAASLDAIEGAMATRGSGAGDNRKRGGGDLIPRWQRWEIRYADTTLESYAKTLDYFGVELAALGGGINTIDYVSFNKGKAVKRTASADAKDERIYFIWQSGKFKQQDRALLGQAGVNTSGRVICQFFSAELENRLAILEKEHLGSRPLKDVRRTIFGVRPQGRGYEFYVIENQWRR